MKNIKIIIFAVSLSFFGCDKYLDESPDDRQEINTLENVAELLVSAYSEGSYNFIEWKTDNAIAIPLNNQYAFLTENFQFVPVISSEVQDTPTYFWSETYKAIAHSNQALAELDYVENTDTEYYNAIKGEALITRAYNHFMLANIFCQHYSTSNASGLGIPYITSPETELQVDYERGTLQETYELIEKDLLEALPLISDKFYQGSGKYHFNKNASYAFASRFFLFFEKYEKSIEYADEMLGVGAISSNFIKDMDVVYTGTSSTEIARNFYEVFDPSNLLVERKVSFFVNRYNRGYGLTRSVADDIFVNTIVQGVGVDDNRDFLYGYNSTGAMNPPKYTELFEYTTATTGFGYYIQPTLRSEEVIFNRMESNARLNNIDAALIDYNTLALTRYDNGGQLDIDDIKVFFTGSDQEAMLEFIYFEKRKEFLREGLRWFDLKRYRKAITHVDIVGDSFYLEEDDLKKAIQIPQGSIAQGIEPNPR